MTVPSSTLSIVPKNRQIIKKDKNVSWMMIIEVAAKIKSIFVL